MFSERRLKRECELIQIDVIPGEINAFFLNSCNYAPHVNSSRDLHEPFFGALFVPALAQPLSVTVAAMRTTEIP
ncbi:hypothetical protein F2P81_004788 [Scophthalmus maximus]|uniref:Uncharacterized protein n=1 Tax=Scophthalmus maximus TaxID=52904 RepID=A0A6A4TKS9_SCOMX|nr:hypothetical protein F2P81_004788 [Scophthalmus maximus]